METKYNISKHEQVIQFIYGFINFARHFCKEFWCWFSRRILKRYLGIETRQYKRWWIKKCRTTQKKLDLQHACKVSIWQNRMVYRFYKA